MKKQLIRSVLAIFAAGIISAAALPIIPVSAAYIRDQDAMPKRYPDIWTDPDTGTVYYSNWSLKDAKFKTMFSTNSKPYSELTVVLPQDTLTEEELTAICKTYFDDSYQFDDIGHFYSETGVAVKISDPSARVETEQKCDLLYEALHDKYELLEFTYSMDIQNYTEYTMFDAWVCIYSANTDGLGTEETQLGENLSAFLAEKYPDWEVRTETGDTQRYAVRKKGFELYDVPMTEYLDISDSIKKELGYTTGRIALAMASYRPKAVKYYLHPMGDVNMNGDVDIADAQFVLQEYCNVVVAKGVGVLTEEQRKLADVVPRQYWNDDNEALMMDAQTILMYYAESLVDLNIQNISVDEWAETYYRDMVLD